MSTPPAGDTIVAKSVDAQLGDGLRSIMIVAGCGAAQMSAVIPLFPIAVRDVTGSTAASGIVTAAFTIGMVLGALQLPRLLDGLSTRSALMPAFVASGVALAGLALLPSLPIMIVLGIVFGLGFGANVTTVGTVIGLLGDTHRRDGALMAYGIASGLAMVVAPSLALLAEPQIGVTGVFVGSAAISGPALVAATFAPRQALPAATNTKFRTVAQNRPLRRGLRVLFGLSLTYGVVASFAPSVTPARGLASSATFFLVFGAFRMIARSGSPILRRFGAERTLVPSILLAAAGSACLATRGAAAEFTAALLLGIGLGFSQPATFVVMLDSEDGVSVASVSALWNAAIDAGIGLGALAFGLAAAGIGYRPSFFVMAMFVAVFAWQTRRSR